LPDRRYYLVDPKLYLDYSKNVVRDTITCSRNENHMRPGARSNPLIVEAKSKVFPELLDSWAGDLLVREDKLPALEGLTGFAFREAFLEHPAHWKGVPRYVELRVTGFGGVLPARGLRASDKCEVCHMLDFENTPDFRFQLPEGNSGGDLFRAWPLLSVIYASQRFADAFSDPERKNCFIPLAENELLGESLTCEWLSNLYPGEEVDEIHRRYGAEMDRLAGPFAPAPRR
jgi:hypothetical protein